MRRPNPARPARLIALLTLLATPLVAHAEPAPAEQEQAATPATEARAPLPERSAVEAAALEQRLEHKEQQQLQAGDEGFLALWLPANVGEPSGAVIIVPGDDESADWPQAVGPLRRKLPDGGWHSLSLTLPDPTGDAPPLRDATAAATPAEPAADASAASAPGAETEAEAEAAEPAAEADNAAAAPASTAASSAPDPEQQRKDHAERVLARIEAGIGFAEQQQAKTIVLLGHGSGAYWAARYLAERKPAKVSKLLLVAATLPAGFSPALDELMAQQQLSTGDFYYKDQAADRLAALKRSQASKRQKHPAYTQVAMKALPGNREAEQEQLYRRIKGWLTIKLQAK